MCHYDWLVQIVAEAAETEIPGIVVHETKECGIEELDSMELDMKSDTMESDAGSEV
jgi:hypothetical protein